MITEDDWSAYRAERNEILEQRAGATALRDSCRSPATGTRSPLDACPRACRREVRARGVEFITGSISAPGLVESAEFGIPKDHPHRALYLHDPPSGSAATINAALRHGVKTCLVLQETSDESKALAARNPDVAPHLSFVDLGGHGYAMVRASAEALDVEFVCIAASDRARPRRRWRAARLSRVAHVPRWHAGELPLLERRDLEGTPPLLA